MKLNERYGKPNAHYMKRLEEITRYAMDDYARILAFRVDLLLPVGNSHKGYDSAVITRFIASLKAQIAAYLQRRRRDGKRVYPCKLRYAWVREFGELNGNKHYHMLLLVNREVFRNTMLNTENSAQPRGLLAQFFPALVRREERRHALLVFERAEDEIMEIEQRHVVRHFVIAHEVVVLIAQHPESENH